MVSVHLTERSVVLGRKGLARLQQGRPFRAILFYSTWGCHESELICRQRGLEEKGRDLLEGKG